MASAMGEEIPEGTLELVLDNEQLVRHVLTQFLSISDQLLYVQTVCRYVDECYMM